VAWSTAGGFWLRVVRTVGDRSVAGITVGGARGADRRGARARRARAAGRRARGARARASHGRALHRSADACAIPIGSPCRRARELSQRPSSAGRRARARAQPRSSTTRAGDFGPRPGAGAADRGSHSRAGRDCSWRAAQRPLDRRRGSGLARRAGRGRAEAGRLGFEHGPGGAGLAGGDRHSQ
jgi:hypothetical protein